MQIHKIKVSSTMNILEDNLSYLDDFKDLNKQLDLPDGYSKPHD